MTSDHAATHRTLLLPGWLNSDADHWQSLWERKHGFQRVEQDDWTWPRRGDWMARLDEILLQDAKPAVLVAHSLGCHLVAAWASHSRHTQRVQAALLVAPPDTERQDMPPNLFSWKPIERTRLTFQSRLVWSDDDPFCSPQRAQSMAAWWGSETTSIGARGHINASSGLADWPEGLTLLRALAGAGA
jgi:predicted alpha/beta hydrolase family esterase